MKADSRFYFTGSIVLTLMAFASATWPLLAIALLATFCGMMVADREQLAALDSRALAMFLVQHERPLLPLDAFRGRELLFYHGGQPVYRYLIGRDTRWQLVGPQDEVKEGPGMIRVWPGYLYRRLDD
ncbi:hypothetical protein [Pseudogulbenkiania sp. MAI-1]|uniref:hypothetical protein n=1 Tax=Pseudogulbenkiania sp. MAI-1 TaxID=990370 RepID=UPI00045E8731|nr:hypothetical protein [Pseudogulbenkiania sp. MAI-1]